MACLCTEGLELRDLQDCIDDFVEKLGQSKGESWIEIWLVIFPLESCVVCLFICLITS